MTYSLLLLLAIASVVAAEPLTHEQALAKIAEWGPDRTADKIVALDTILQATQENGGVKLTWPAAAVILFGQDVSVAWQGAILLDIADILHAEITPEPVVARNVVPGLKWWIGPAWAGGGAVVVVVLLGLFGHLK